MANTRIELALEYESGLTEEAIEAQFRQQYGDDLVEIEVVQE
jgi:hypothetical protein